MFPISLEIILFVRIGILHDRESNIGGKYIILPVLKMITFVFVMPPAVFLLFIALNVKKRYVHRLIGFWQEDLDINRIITMCIFENVVMCHRQCLMI